MMNSEWVSFGLWLALVPATAFASSNNNRATFIQLAPLTQWQVTNVESLSLAQLSRWGAIASIDAEYGAKDAELRTYVRQGLKIQAVIEEASDPSAAFGLLTFYQTDKMRPVPGMTLAVMGPEMALMARGDAFVRVPLPGGRGPSEAVLRSFLISIGKARPSSRSLELLPASLPEKEMIPGSEKYVLGPEAASRAIPWFPANLMGFPRGAEVHTATYRRREGQISLMLIRYPTPQIAQLRFSAMQDQLGLNREGQSVRVFGKRDGSFVFVVNRSGSATRSQALALMNELTVTKTVTAYEKYPGQPVAVQMLELIIANIILISILIGMAIVAGVLMVIGRRMLAKWFPEATWAQAGENTLIQLHLEWR
jgi:Family of unknown function (DUF6599)